MLHSLQNNIWKGGLIVLVVFFALQPTLSAQAPPAPNPQSGSVGVQGKISAPPPSNPASISLPRDGQTFTTLPISVSGLCSGDVLVKIFKNNVFGGATQCKNGSFSIAIDLFTGRNELVARVYDSLDQAGPDSNIVAVNYSDPASVVANRVILTSNFAKRGASPGQALTWPIILSGGTGPYAVSVDWGDGEKLDLISVAYPGPFNISHTYRNSGLYNVIVKASDKNGEAAFLQLVAVANGPLAQETQAANGGAGGSSSGSSSANGGAPTKILWQPAAVMIPFVLSTFWLGKRYEIKTLRRKIERGQHPFK